MRIDPSAAGFQRWLRFVFEHPDTSAHRPWYDRAMEPYEIEPDVFLAHMTALFKDCGRLLAPFSDLEVEQGLNYLINPAVNDDCQNLVLAEASAREYAECVRAMGNLYSDIWAKRCAPVLSHLDQKGGPLNSICYMWWDVIAFSPSRHVDIEQAYVAPAYAVMERALSIPHVACQESALHGLGHWQADDPERVAAIVDLFLARGGHPPELERYAREARAGRVN